MQEIISEIKKLKEEKNALVLAHYYEPLEIWEIADAVGDSLELSKKAAAAGQDRIVFCGVRFMAESAKILNPAKKVLLPVKDATCPMADMISADQLRALKKLHPGAKVVCYVNSSAEVKAESDICCTSSNAARVVGSLDAEKIIFIPDKNLGRFVSEQFPEKEFIFIDGYCPVHNDVTRLDIQKSRLLHPKALVASHPECGKGVSELSDYVGSTTGIMNFCRENPAHEFVIGTEIEITRALQKEMPDKKFYSAKNGFLCDNMKKTSLEDVLAALREDRYEIHLPEDIREKAASALEKMIRL